MTALRLFVRRPEHSTIKRIALIAPLLDPRDGRLLKQRASLRAAGFVVEAFAPDPGGAPFMADAHPVPWIGPLGVLARAPGPLGLWLRFALKTAAMRRAVSRFAPDLLLVSEPESLRWAAAIRRRVGAAVIYDAHEYYEDETPGDTARSRWVARTHARHAHILDGFVTVGPAIARLYAQAQPAFPPAVVVMNAAQASAPPPYDGRLHQRAGLPPDASILIFHGAMSEHRGLRQLVDAAERLPPGWWLVMLGDGVLRRELEARAGDRVRFVSPVPHDELPLWISGAALGALLYETGSANQLNALPNKLWEYPAAGVPVLASALPEIVALTQDAGFVDFVPPDIDPSAIAEAVATAAKQPQAVRRAAARAFASGHGWDREAEKLVALARVLSRA